MTQLKEVVVDVRPDHAPATARELSSLEQVEATSHTQVAGRVVTAVEPPQGSSKLLSGTTGALEGGVTGMEAGLDGRPKSSWGSQFMQKLRELRRFALGSQLSETSSDLELMSTLPRNYAVLVTRLMMMTMLAVFVAATTLATWYFTSVASTRTVSKLGSQLRYDLLNRTGERMSDLLTRQRGAVILTSRMMYSDLQLGSLDTPAVFNEVDTVMRITFTALPFITNMVLNDANGSMSAYARIQITNSTTARYGISKNSTAVGSSGNVTVYPISPSNGKPIGPSLVAGDYVDPRRRQWYLESLQIARDEEGSNSVSWELLVNNLAEPLMYCAQAIRSSTTQQPVAVLGVAQSLSTLADYLSILDLKGGQLFFVSSAGYMIVGTGAAVGGPPGPPGVMRQPRRINESDPLTISAWTYLEAKHGSAALFSVPQAEEDVKINGVEYYIDSLPVQIYGLSTVGVVMLPRSSIMGVVDHHNRITVIALSALASGIFLLGCLMTVILTSRVSNEIKLKAQLIRHLEQRRKAEAESTAKSTFLANMSHELRTPMACVLGLLDILLADDITPEQKANLHQIRHCSTALLALLNNILDIGKIEAGKLELECVNFDLAAELESIVDMFSVQCRSKGVEVALALSDELPQLVCGDSARIRQIFTNLLSNAAKFSSPGGHIVVRLWPTALHSVEAVHAHRKVRWEDEKGQSGRHQDTGPLAETEVRLAFEVQDSGCGIPPEKREKVFECFVQADASTTRLHGGTGLGLSIVRSLVEMMGGSVRVADPPEGGGALIRGTIMVGVDPDSPVTLRSLAEKRMPRGLLGGAQVVLAMEGQSGRAIAACWMRSWGLQVFEAVRWHEALELTTRLAESTRPPNGVFSGPLTSLGSNSGLATDLYQSQSGPVGVPPSRWREPLIVLLMDASLLTTCGAKGSIVSGEKAPPAEEDESLSADWQMVRPQLPTLLQPLHQFKSTRVIVAWLLASDVPSSVRHFLRDQGFSLVSGMPFYPTRILDVFGHIGTEVTNPTKKLQSPNTDISSKTESDSASAAGSVSTDSSENEDPNRSRPVIGAAVESSKGVFGGKAGAAVRAGQKPTPLQGLRVLVAEDTSMLQRLAVMMLKKMGAKDVIAVENGQQAVEAVLASEEGDGPQFDFVLMDCQMPVCDGYEATRRIREWEAKREQRKAGSGRHMPIVALTAHAMASDEKKCLAAGMDAYLSKPIDTELLVRTILPLVGRKEPS